MKKSIELVGRDVYKVRLLESGLKYDSESKMKDKTYSRFRYNGTVFIVPDADPFVKDFKAGKVHTIWLLEGQRTVEIDGTDTPITSLEFDAHISNAQVIGQTETEAILARIMAGSFKQDAELTAEELKELEGQG